MQTFKKAYNDFISGTASVDSFALAVDEFLQRSPAHQKQVQMALAKLHQAGKLSKDDFARLITLVIEQAEDDDEEDPDNEADVTVKADDTDTTDDENSEQTVVRSKTSPTKKRSTTTSRTSRSQFTWTGFGDGDSAPIEVGSVIKERFLVESVIGSGGMGFIFKAKDLRKEEAQDRNPWVAIKVLNEDFKQHPEALKALQREARKSQDLSHPNIITVFDFDRDGDNVYMTMELMEGIPLDKFIKTLKETPIPVEEALRISHDMGQALAYAHKAGIVHSDFKPGNVFLVKDNAVKVFDFGIARASKQGLAGAQGEMTKFDAGTLGALTPAYASLEMMIGEEPDARDDIYALACVTYELLTGKHPFEKKSADLAAANKMTVAPVKGLDRKQMKGLMKGLAFRRADRSESVEQFLDDMRKKKMSKSAKIGSVAAAMTIVVATAVGVPIYLEKRTINTTIDVVAQSNSSTIVSAMNAILALEQDLRQQVVSNIATQEKIISLIKIRVDEIFNIERKAYDYLGAKDLLARGTDFYKDSATLKELVDNTEKTRNTLMLMLDTLYTQYLEAGNLLDDGTPENIPAVLTIVKQVEPDSYLLRDKRLPNAYLSSAQQRLASSDVASAEKITQAGLERFNTDVALINFQDLIQSEKIRQQQAARIAELTPTIDTALANLTPESNLEELIKNMQELRSFDDATDLIKRIQTAVESLATVELEKTKPTENWAAYQFAIARYKPLASTVWLAEKQGFLTSKEHGANFAITESIKVSAKAELAANLAKLDELLAKPDFKPAWETSVRILFEDMDAIAAAYNETDTLKDAHQRVAAIYASQINAATSKERFNEADSLMQRANRLSPGAAELAAEATLLASAKAVFEEARQRELLLARIDALKQSILTQAKANDVANARKSRDELARLAPEDAFLSKEAAQALVAAYNRLAKLAAKGKDFEQAVAMTKTALEFTPADISLKTDLQAYTLEVKKADIAKAFKTPSKESMLAAEQLFTELRAGMSTSAATAMQQEIIASVAANIKALVTQDAYLASVALPEAKRIFGDHPSLTDIELPQNIQAPPEPEPAPGKVLKAVEDQTGLDMTDTEESLEAVESEENLFKKTETAAREGDINSQIELASAHFEGNNHVRRDYRKAAEWYEKAAKQAIKEGKVTAQIVSAESALGGMYFNGTGVEKDIQKALYWHEQAAEGGNIASQSFIATVYLEGKETTQDYAKAIKWFTKASAKGNAHSQAGLGFMYFNGFGVTQDYAKAFDLFLKAGKQGEESSVSALGIMYLKGIGTSQNNIQAYAWLSLASKYGDKDSGALIPEASAALTPDDSEKAKTEAAKLIKTIKVKKGV